MVQQEAVTTEELCPICEERAGGGADGALDYAEASVLGLCCASCLHGHYSYAMRVVHGPEDHAMFASRLRNRLRRYARDVAAQGEGAARALASRLARRGDEEDARQEDPTIAYVPLVAVATDHSLLLAARGEELLFGVASYPSDPEDCLRESREWFPDPDAALEAFFS